MMNVTNLNRLGIVGFSGTTREYFRQDLPVLDEVWSINYGHRYGLDVHATRWFELHDPDMLSLHPSFKKDHWPWLQQPHDFPIFMQEAYPEVPASVRYPRDEVLEDLFAGMYRQDQGGLLEPHQHVTSTIGWMLAYALYTREWDEIRMYGVELDSGTEYMYQHAGIGMMIGAALSRGVRMVFPPGGVFLDAPLYGYEAVDMVSRQSLERYLENYTARRDYLLSRVNVLNTRVLDLHRQLADLDDGDERAEALKTSLSKNDELFQQAVREMYLYVGAVQVVEKLVDEVDLKKPDMELKDIVVREPEEVV